MKKLSNYVVAVLCVGSLAFSAGAFMKVNATPAATAAPAGQPVDLTYAAEKALPAVVHIKYVQNSKVKTVDVQDDPFGGFFDRSASSATRDRATEEHASRKCRLQRERLPVRASSSVRTVTSLPTTTW